MSKAGCFVAEEEYVQDILNWLRILEKHQFVTPLRSPQLFRRRQLIDWTCGICARLGLTTQTVHMAVRYLDRFMSGHDIKEPQLYLVCSCSVLLASKVCERESLIPRLSTLTALLPVKLSVHDLHSLELVMLNYFSWDLNMATVCYTAELLLPYSLEIRELKPVTKRFHSFNTLKMELLKTVKEMLDICLVEESFMQTVSSMTAVTCLQTSRLVCGLPWSSRLDNITGYTREKIQTPTDCLLSLYKLHCEDEVIVIDEGYVSHNYSVNNSISIC